VSAHEAGRQFGYAAFPVILLAIAAYAGWRMGKKRQPPKFVVWPIVVAAILLALSAVGLQMKKQRESLPSYSETR
jgi:MFS family permease